MMLLAQPMVVRGLLLPTTGGTVLINPPASVASDIALTLPSLGGTLVTSGSTWGTSGNALTGGGPATPTERFGSSNNYDVVMLANNTERIRLNSAGGATFTDAVVGNGPQHFSFVSNVSVTPTASATGVVVGLASLLTTASTQDQNGRQVLAFAASAQNNTPLGGVAPGAITGIAADVEQLSSATSAPDNVTALNTSLRIAGPTVDNAIGVQIGAEFNANINTWRGLAVFAPNGTGTITDATALFVEELSVGHVFKYNSVTSPVEVLANGNVGIGKAEPLARVHIAATNASGNTSQLVQQTDVSSDATTEAGFGMHHITQLENSNSTLRGAAQSGTFWRNPTDGNELASQTILLAGWDGTTQTLDTVVTITGKQFVDEYPTVPEEMSGFSTMYVRGDIAGDAVEVDASVIDIKNWKIQAGSIFNIKTGGSDRPINLIYPPADRSARTIVLFNDGPEKITIAHNENGFSSDLWNGGIGNLDLVTLRVHDTATYVYNKFANSGRGAWVLTALNLAP
jgi:hypothetical protein